ncbi:hypothetical protein N8873_08940 [Flavobacteriaceae bacterium]|jgi:hypothetical protein|nr:hypothetical protein [Flavobacteriaceae bacterium]
MKKGSHPKRFDNIPQYMLESMGRKERENITTYRAYMNLIEKWISEIYFLKEDIKEIEGNILKYQKLCDRILAKYKDVEQEYQLNFNVSTQKKKTGKHSLSVYWIINFKYKAVKKTIYLGSDKKMRKIIGNRLGTEKILSESRVKKEIREMTFDNLYHYVRTQKNLGAKTIKLKDLL